MKYLALRTGHDFVRINNHVLTHAHPDVQEYLGTYVSNAMGNLVFQEGPLVTAVRNGSWVVLDELNLAPSEVLEMLNRLLDDNRELMIPDTQEIIKPHPDFAIFATQNPTGACVGPIFCTVYRRNHSNHAASVGTVAERSFQEPFEAGFSRCTWGKSQIWNLFRC